MHNGFDVVAEKYVLGIADCQRYNYPDEKRETAQEIDTWININTKPVWDFYVAVLEQNEQELLSL